MSDNKRSRPDKEPEEPNYEVSTATVEACLESLQPNAKDNVHYIADHDQKEGSTENNN